MRRSGTLPWPSRVLLPIRIGTVPNTPAGCQGVSPPYQTSRGFVRRQSLLGKPVMKETRPAIEFIVDLLAQGWSEARILESYPGITREDILACQKQ